MKFIDLIKLSTRMFRARTSRTILTIFGIGVGTATILFLISLGFGVQEVVLDRITTSDSLSSIDVYSNPEKNRELNQKTIDQFGYINELEKIIPLLKYDGQIKTTDKLSNTSFFITDPGYLSMDGKKILAGKTLSDENENGIVLSSAFLKIFGVELEDLLKEKIEITLSIPSGDQGQFLDKKIEKSFEVIGVVENDRSNVFVNFDSFKSEGLEDIFLIKVKARNSNQVDGVKAKIEALGYKTSSVSEVVEQSRKFFSVASLILAILGVVALFVSSIGMFNTMIITLLERTEEIGIMKAIGATDRNILSIFIFESALMGFLGGVSGIFMGFVVQYIFNFVVNFIAVRMGGEAFDLFHSPLWFIALLITSSLLIGIFTGLIPARKASIVDPLDALKRR